MLAITPPTAADWRHFLDLAAVESWRVPPQELALYRGPLADNALVLKEGETPLGFVTAVPHETSGWIGNLIVPAAYRGFGHGGQLFDLALARLDASGIEAIWLTASEQGRPLYERRGFRSVDGVVRWTKSAPGGEASALSPPLLPPGPREHLFEQDRLAWGESRAPLLTALVQTGSVFASGETVALVQDGAGQRLIGPWLSPSQCPRENRRLLADILSDSGGVREWVADVIESSPLQPLLAAVGFTPAGRTELMVRGETRADLSRIVALASLGSLG